MTSSTKTTDQSKSNLVSLQKGFPQRPEKITLDVLQKMAEDLVQFEMNYQRQQFESFTAIVSDLTSLKAAGSKFRFKSETTSGSEKPTQVNVVELRAKAPAKNEQGG